MTYWRSLMIRNLTVTVLLLILLAVNAYGIPRYAVFPQFVSGQGWTSEIFFANQGLSEVSGISVRFYGKNGFPLVLETNLGTASAFTINLGAGTTKVITVVSSDTYLEGYVVIQYPWTGSPVRATEIFRYEQDGTVLAELSVPQQEQGDHFSFPVEVDASRRIHTAVGFINPREFRNAAQTLIVDLIRLDGGIAATAQVRMQAGHHLAGYLDEDWLFPGLDNFVGSISVSSPFGVGVLAVRQEKEAFGAISTDGGPILGPFAVSGGVLPDLEPNNTPAQATFVTGSRRIAGTIGYAGDMDVFAFSGQLGEVVSVICDTLGTGSYLDSYLELYDSNYNLIAVNDQNGSAPQLYPINDSFIQVALPANDVYYIVVSDYFGDGGSEYDYTLHIKLP